MREYNLEQITPTIGAEISNIDLSQDLSEEKLDQIYHCLLYTSPSPRDATLSRMPSSA